MVTQKTFAFLSELKRHNDRDWFQAHKADYLAAKEEFETLAADLIRRIAVFDKSVEGLDARKCCFRIFRDARFAKDKSPYKTNFGAHISAKANKFQERAGYYLHVEPGGCFLGGGAYMPSSPWLKAIRNAIAEDGKFFRRLITAPTFKKQFGTMTGETLKTVPQGFSAGHPHIDLLRHKGFLAMRQLKDAEVKAADFPKAAAAAFKALQPFERFLNDVLEP
ncbi:MAG: DUF2461 domain-containing protein [Fibrobacteria bacterium]